MIVLLLKTVGNSESNLIAGLCPLLKWGKRYKQPVV